MRFAQLFELPVNYPLPKMSHINNCEDYYMLVLSYPRSGSDYLVNAINHYQRHKLGYSLSLQEWTNTASQTTWLNIHAQRRSISQGVATQIRTFTVNEEVDPAHCQHVRDLLTGVTITVHSHIELDHWITQEHAKRLCLLAQLERAQLAHVVKWFPGSGSCRPIAHQGRACVMLYRQNFTECLLSQLIKHLHYNQGALDIGHNYLGRPAIAIAEPVELAEATVLYHAQLFAQFLVMYRDSEPMPTISYEHMMAGGTVSIRGEEISPKMVTECHIKRPEYAMDYSLTGTKWQFFTNSEIVPKIIAGAMDQAGVGHVIDQLAIHW